MLTRYSMPPDWPAALRRMFPRLTDDQIARFAILVEADNLISDAGLPTLAFVGWCKDIGK